MAATHNLCVKAGEYTTMDGQTKSRWQRIGLVFKHEDGGTSIKLESMPVGVPGWDGWVSVFARDQQDGAQQQGEQYRHQPQSQGQNQQRPVQQRQQRRQQQAAPTQQFAATEFDDDIPF